MDNTPGVLKDLMKFAEIGEKVILFTSQEYAKEHDLTQLEARETILSFPSRDILGLYLQAACDPKAR